MKKIILPILLAILLILISCTGYYLFYLNSNPHIYPDDSYTGTLTAEYTFPFKDSSVTLFVSVPASTYQGAGNAGSKTIPYTKILTLEYYNNIINDPLQEEMYAQILDQTDHVRTSWSLTDDEYVELLATFVQSIPYTTKEDYRYPVETVIDKFGDCDDKSMLLIGLLTRAGYDAVLLVFEEESHATVGIKTTDTTAYPNTGGYAILETTSYSYVTDKSFTFEDGTSLESTPVVITAGEGTKTYTAGYQIGAILAYRDKAEEQINLLSSKTESNTNTLETMEETMIQYETRLNSLAVLINTELSAYNSYIDQANAITAQQKKLNSDYNSNKITYAEYVQQWDILKAEQTELLTAADEAWDGYTAYQTKYETLYAEYQAYFSTYTNAYANYSNTVGEQNRFVNIYNLIISEPYNREYVYQTVVNSPNL
jgi:hypothetical protein